MECENAYIFVYVLGVVLVATTVAVRALSAEERIALLVLLCPGVGLFVYLAFVALSFELFSAKVLRLIIVLETVMALLAYTTYLFLQNCSTNAILIACLRALFTHLLLLRFF